MVNTYVNTIHKVEILNALYLAKGKGVAGRADSVFCSISF